MEKSTKIILGSMAGVVLIGGSIGAYFYFKNSDEDKPVEDKKPIDNTSANVEEKTPAPVKPAETKPSPAQPSAYFKAGDKMYLTVGALNSAKKNNTAFYAYNQPFGSATKDFEIAPDNKMIGFYVGAAPNGFFKIRAYDNKDHYVRALLSDKSRVYGKSPAF